MTRLRVHVKPSVCTGEALCTGIAPRVFEMVSVEGEHKARVKDPGGRLHEQQTLDVDDDGYDRILEAAERCPPEAIFVYEIDEVGNETQLFP